jgi:hypothetical protein
MGALQGDYAPQCPICGIPMAVVFIEPKITSLTELRVLRCFCCGNVRSVQQKIRPQDETSRVRPSFFD